MVIVLAWALLAFASLVLAAGLFTVAYLRRMHRREVTFRAIAESASDGLVLMQEDSRILWANPAYCRIMGYALDEVVGRYPLEFALPKDIALSSEEARKFRFDPEEERFGKLSRLRNMRKTGEEFMHEFSHALVNVPGARERRYLLVGRDISESVAREQQLIEARERLTVQARTDPLTGLANRIHLRHEIEALAAQGVSFAVMQIDMNDFKGINDTHGHSAGDAILKHFARIFRAQARDGCIAARTGGDEFMMIAPHEGELETAMACARQLAEAVRAPMSWGAGEISARASIGVAVWVPDDLTLDEVLNRADVALYTAKTQRDCPVAGYDDAMHARYVAEQTLRQDIADAVGDAGLSFHFQPIVDLAEDRVARFEMLVRWDHPDRGLLPPGVFLPVIESLGLSIQLDRQVVDAAVNALPRLDAAGLSRTGLAVNLTAAALAGGEIPELLVWLAESGQLDPARITVELLETTAFALTEDDATIRNIVRLSRAGFAFVLDDFGMGHAGIAHLAALTLEGLKIDRQLTSAVETDRTCASIVDALVDLAGQLDMHVVAEGVETASQINVIRRMGCRLFQGFAVARPMPLDDAIGWAATGPRVLSRRVTG